MMNNLYRLLAIGVDSLNPTTVAAEPAPSNDYIKWVLLGFAVLAAAMLVVLIIKSHPVEKFRSIKRSAKEKHEKKQRDAELDRLHEIKRKNKRK